ncbi:hypothetical protein [Saccharopolyspora sp. NPDC002686]|uniref:hypothetical protein n=1 Tax=Saccharopolyspora sp. NPDC002686 TaxID=3154541 RepID=UPI0033187D3E
MAKPCIEKKRSMWDGSVITYCGRKEKAPKECWLNYNAFTRSDTCPKCVAAHDRTAG